MGVHNVNGTLLNGGEIDASRPQALIYELEEGGKLRLVGIEFIVFAAPWLASNNNAPSVLAGVYCESSSRSPSSAAKSFPAQ